MTGGVASRAIVDALGRLLAWPILLLVQIYRVTISPVLGANCRFEPTCSSYAIEALRQYGAFRGSVLAAKRIARCHPWGSSGYDPVPGPGPEADTDEDRNAR